MRLNKYLAKAGIGSRRKCDEFIAEGLIKINESVVKDFSYQVKENDVIKYRNRSIDFVQEDVLYLLNKPKNYICTSYDPYDRRKVVDLIPSNKRLFTVGRLDYKTTGLIVITNNGDIANKLMHPRNNVIRKYEVCTDKKINRDTISKIKHGIKINRNIYKANISLNTKLNNPNIYIWKVVLEEGKNREIRNIFDHLGHKIIQLHRYEFAGIKLGNLKIGKYKKIKISDLNKKLNIKVHENPKK